MKTLLFFLLCSSPCLAQWQQLSDLPAPGRDDAVGFSFGESIYVGTGMDVNFGCRNDFYRYTGNTDSWQQIDPIPGIGRQYCASFATADAGYVFGGVNGSGQQLNEMWKYSGEKWTQKASFPGLARDKSLALYYGGRAWIIGGRNGKSELNEIWTYSPEADEWSRQGELPFGGRFDLVGYVQYDRFYMGMGSDSASHIFKDWWCYDPNAGIWQKLADYPGQNTVYNMATAFETRSLVCGGVDVKNGFHKESFEYLPGSNTWKEAEVPGTGLLKGSVMLQLNKSFYLLAGINNSFTRQTSVFKLPIETNSGYKALGKIKVFPNPGNENLIILKEFNGDDRSYIKIFDHMGRLVFSREDVVLPYVMTIADLPEGVYSVQTLYGSQKFIRN